MFCNICLRRSGVWLDRPRWRLVDVLPCSGSLLNFSAGGQTAWHHPGGDFGKLGPGSQDHIMILPPLCFTVEMRFWCWIAASFLLHLWLVFLNSSAFVSPQHKTFGKLQVPSDVNPNPNPTISRRGTLEIETVIEGCSLKLSQRTDRCGPKLSYFWH